MHFNFSAIDTSNVDSTIQGFKKEVIRSIEKFIAYYNLDFYINSSTTYEEIITIMKENYDGYKFSEDAEESVYNSNMCLYFLKEYKEMDKIPEKLVDVNIVSDYDKIGKMLNLCEGKQRLEIIEKSLTDEGLINEINQKFNPAMQFNEDDIISMLFYLGYLTITLDDNRFSKLIVPNNVMKEIYSSYFLTILDNEINTNLNKNYKEISMEIAINGKIEKLTDLVHEYLNNLSNRDYQNFDEKYIKLIFYAITMNLNVYRVKSELEVNKKYPDLLLIPKERDKGYYTIMIEFKYLKKAKESLLKQEKEETKEQLLEYSQFEEIKNIEKLKKYTVIAIAGNDKFFIDEV